MIDDGQSFSFTIPAGRFENLAIQVTDLQGFWIFEIEVVQQRGTLDDISVDILDHDNFLVWSTRRIAKILDSVPEPKMQMIASAKFYWGALAFKPIKIGDYHLALDNTHSSFASKVVNILAHWLPYESVNKTPSTLKLPSQPQTNIDVFQLMDFHTRIANSSSSLFKNGHYSPAIFEAFKVVNNAVKERSGIKSDGKALMGEVFSETNPLIKFNDFPSDSDKNEQEGFKFLFMGAMVGIRNPRAHEALIETDPILTTKYLAFADLLLRKLDSAQNTMKRN